MHFFFFPGAISVVLDSLDTIQCLSDSTIKDKEFILSILDDRKLHTLLDVSIFFYYIVIEM